MQSFIIKFFTLVLAVTVFLAIPAFAFQAKVIGIADGDTITVLTEDNQKIRVRLYGIDCPEKSQAFGGRAKQFTAQAVYGWTVEIEPVDTDRYGRTVGIVSLNGKSLNESLIKAGYAWYYATYCNEKICNFWKALERSAQADGLGLWSQVTPRPPWVYRRSKKTESSKAGTRLTAPEVVTMADLIKLPQREQEAYISGVIKTLYYMVPQMREAIEMMPQYRWLEMAEELKEDDTPQGLLQSTPVTFYYSQNLVTIELFELDKERKQVQKTKDVYLAPPKGSVTKTYPKTVSPSPTYSPYRGQAENGDYYGVDNDGDGRTESIHVKGYYRSDGTYVRGHYRAKPK